MTEVLEEAYEPVEKGLMTEQDFKDFVFTNPAKLWTAGNPDFFKGTRVEKAVADLRYCRLISRPVQTKRAALSSSCRLLWGGLRIYPRCLCFMI